MHKTILVLVAASLVASATTANAQSCDLGPSASSATATYYTSIDSGACGFGTIPTGTFPFGAVAAVSSSDWAGSALCGLCLEITGPLGSVVALVSDSCPVCSTGDLDLSLAAFQAIANPADGVANISYHTVACDAYPQVRLRSADGVSPWWYALTVMDHRYGISRVEIQGNGSSTWLDAVRSNSNSWEVQDPNGLDVPLSIRVTDVVGGQVEDDGLIGTITSSTDYLMSGQLPTCDPTLIFKDGFESGSLAAWSSVVP